MFDKLLASLKQKGYINYLVFDSSVGALDVCVNRRTGVVYINPASWHKLQDYQKCYILLHEVGHYVCQTKDEFEADRFAFGYLVAGDDQLLRFTQIVNAVAEVLNFKHHEHYQRLKNMLVLALKKDFEKNKNPKAQKALNQLNMETDEKEYDPQVEDAEVEDVVSNRYVGVPRNSLMINGLQGRLNSAKVTRIPKMQKQQKHEKSETPLVNNEINIDIHNNEAEVEVRHKNEQPHDGTDKKNNQQPLPQRGKQDKNTNGVQTVLDSYTSGSPLYSTTPTVSTTPVDEKFLGMERGMFWTVLAVIAFIAVLWYFKNENKDKGAKLE